MQTILDKLRAVKGWWNGRRLNTTDQDMLAQENPIPLLTVDSNGGLVLENDAIDHLLKLQEPVSVISTVGPYRRGKSYLMNYLAGKHDGFPVGDTVQAETKGIWMWLLRHPTREKEYVLLLDAEGQGDTVGNDDRSVKIYILLIILSSSLIINCTNVIDNDVMQLLEMVGKLAEKLVINGNEDNFTDLQEIFPTLHFVVRDFHLKLEINGTLCSNDKYLEHCLESTRSRQPQTRLQNRQRETLKTLFRDRHLHTLPPPVFKGQAINIRQNQEFHSQLKDLCQILHETKQKILQNVPIMAEHLVILIKHCMEAFNHGRIPTLQVTFDTFAQHQSGQGEKKAVQKYDEYMKNVLEHLPMSEAKLQDEHNIARKKACAVFTDGYSMFDKNGKVLSKIQEQFDKKLDTYIRNNEEEGCQYCRKALNALYDSHVKPYIQDGKYKSVDGAEKYIQDFGQVEVMYRELPQEVPPVCAKKAWEEFDREHSGESATIQQNSLALEELQSEAATQDLMYKLQMEDRGTETDRMHTLNAVMEDQQREQSEEIARLRRDLEKQHEHNNRLLDEKTMSDMERETVQRQNRQLERSLDTLRHSQGQSCIIQ